MLLQAIYICSKCFMTSGISTMYGIAFIIPYAMSDCKTCSSLENFANAANTVPNKKLNEFPLRDHCHPKSEFEAVAVVYRCGVPECKSSSNHEFVARVESWIRI